MSNIPISNHGAPLGSPQRALLRGEPHSRAEHLSSDKGLKITPTRRKSQMKFTAMKIAGLVLAIVGFMLLISGAATFVGAALLLGGMGLALGAYYGKNRTKFRYFGNGADTGRGNPPSRPIHSHQNSIRQRYLGSADAVSRAHSENFDEGDAQAQLPANRRRGGGQPVRRHSLANASNSADGFDVHEVHGRAQLSETGGLGREESLHPAEDGALSNSSVQGRRRGGKPVKRALSAAKAAAGNNAGHDLNGAAALTRVNPDGVNASTRATLLQGALSDELAQSTGRRRQSTLGSKVGRTPID